MELAVAILGIVGGAAGAGSLLVAVWALVYARQSRDISNGAKQLSSTANDLSVASNRIAEEARDLATEANEYAHRSEQRETERHDVDWEMDWERPGRYLVTNGGEDSAYDVKVTVTIDDEEARGSAATLGPGESVALDFPHAAQEFVREVQEWNQRPTGYPYVGPSMIETSRYFHTQTYRILWSTQQGSPREDSQHGFTPLGDWNGI
ncbi:hypothetical protein ACFWBG_30480 [Nocardia salmonicida]|uniref:hypothetical protein n=1 Tax=Nocardia salmonicida TaxID=53431 RepID=UPI00366C697E